MDKTIPGDLPALWRERAETLRTHGDPNSARLWDIAAVELERAQALFADETLTLVQAARVSGYTADHLGSLAKRGKIANAGRTNAPRIRRQDLPPAKRPGGRGRPARTNEVDAKRTARVRKYEGLQAEANGLTDRYELPALKLETLAEPPAIDVPAPWRHHIVRPSFEFCEHNLRQHRDYSEIRASDHDRPQYGPSAGCVTQDPLLSAASSTPAAQLIRD